MISVRERGRPSFQNTSIISISFLVRSVKSVHLLLYINIYILKLYEYYCMQSILFDAF